MAQPASRKTTEAEAEALRMDEGIDHFFDRLAAYASWASPADREAAFAALEWNLGLVRRSVGTGREWWEVEADAADVPEQ